MFERVLATVIVGVVIYFLEKFSKRIFQKMDALKVNEIIRIAVEATEQLAKTKEMTKQEKFQHTYNFVEWKLKEQGIELDFESIKFLIEAFVYELPKGGR